MASGTILAKAVYDNIAESADELEFHRGDIVTVIEQNTAGLEGWWLCSLNGRQGIAPGNRLRIIPIMHGIAQQQISSPLQQSSENILEADDDEEYDIPTHRYPNLNTPDPNEVYDVPSSLSFTSRSPGGQDPSEIYDVPPPQVMQTSLLRSSQDNILTSSPQHRTVTIEQEVYDIPSNLMVPINVSNISNDQDPMEIYDVPTDRSGTALTAEDPEEVYDVPLSNKVVEQIDVSALLEQKEEEEEEDEEYDIPPSRPPGMIPSLHITSPPSRNGSSFLASSPDIIYDTPSSNRLAQLSHNSSGYKVGNSNSLPRFSPANRTLTKQESEDYVYDVPPQVTRDQPVPVLKQNEVESLDSVIKRLSLVDPIDGQQARKSTSSSESLFSIIAANANYTELNLELSSAIDKLIKLKQSLEDSVSALLTHVFEGWRQKENISGKIGIIKEVFENVIKNVLLFLEFARGAMANAFAAHERGLSSSLPRSIITGMHKLLQPLEEDNLMLQQAYNALNQACWSLSKLVGEETNIGIPDEIDSFVVTSRAVSDDARQMAAFIHTQSQSLFKRVEAVPQIFLEKQRAQKVQQMVQARPLPELPSPSPQNTRTSMLAPQKQGDDPGLDDYDYVALEEQNSPEVTRQAANIIKNISPEVKLRHKDVLQVLEMSNKQQGVPLIVDSAKNQETSGGGDRFTVQDMVDDVPVMIENLVIAIKHFYDSIDNSEPPKTFVSLSKRVILCAHELVFFGDILYRRLQHPPLQEMVKGHCTQLCTSLKRTVAATKNAAQQWPAEKAVQEMIDRVTDITATAHQFRVLLSQCKIR